VSGPSQPKVEDEQWSDERIQGFLSLKPLDGSDPDYHVLIQAYQHMTPDFFQRFIAMFAESGRNINALSLSGETIFDRVSEHAKSQAYSDVLKSNAALKSSEL
jgi:hypothetical protein